MSDSNTETSDTGAGVRPFGTLDGVPVEEVTIRSAGGAEARIITYGAVVRDLVVPTRGGPQHVVLGLNSIEDYKAHSPHFGAVPGRFANRLAGGRFSVDGRSFQVPTNEGGVNALHGGGHGFGKRVWSIVAHTANSVTLGLRSADGDAGFPGNLEVTCTYMLLEPATLRYELHAATDAPTVVNLTNHSYFNLDGSADILDHEMLLHAAHYTPVDAHLIPTGEVATVDGTPFDFRQPRSIRNAAEQRYDINFVVDGTIGQGGLKPVARVRSPRNGLTMDVHSDQPGVQFYDAAKLNCPVPGIDGAHYGGFGGFCLETQNFPDAPNHPNFPNAVLRVGERYSNITEFRFS